MATSYPTSIDSFSNPISTNPMTSPDHATQHANANLAIEAIETAIGTSGVPLKLGYVPPSGDVTGATDTAAVLAALGNTSGVTGTTACKVWGNAGAYYINAGDIILGYKQNLAFAGRGATTINVIGTGDGIQQIGTSPTTNTDYSGSFSGFTIQPYAGSTTTTNGLHIQNAVGSGVYDVLAQNFVGALASSYGIGIWLDNNVADVNCNTERLTMIAVSTENSTVGILWDVNGTGLSHDYQRCLDVRAVVYSGQVGYLIRNGAILTHCVLNFQANCTSGGTILHMTGSGSVINDSFVTFMFEGVGAGIVIDASVVPGGIKDCAGVVSVYSPLTNSCYNGGFFQIYGSVQGAALAANRPLMGANDLSDVADAGSSRFNLSNPTLSAVAAVAVANVTISSPGATLDSYTLLTADEILLTAQTTGSQNGVWTWNGSTSALTRPNEFPSAGVVKRGRTVTVIKGTVYANTQWILDSTAAGITIDTTSQTWVTPAASVSPATTVTGPDAYGASAVVGTGTNYARQDHNHGLPAANIPPPEMQPITNYLAVSLPRNIVVVSTLTGNTTSVVRFVAVYLYAGQVVGHLSFATGTVAAVTPTHSWLCLTDASGNMVAVTQDGGNGTGSNALAASTVYTYAIANIASGASTTYTVPATGVYYVGIGITAATTPTYIGVVTSVANFVSLSPISSGISSTTYTTGPPSFATTFTVTTANPQVPWVGVTT
jgi:hypothetical protein